MLKQTEANIEKLGFRAHDAKILLNTRADIDHCGGFAAFKRQTGATVAVSKMDGALMAQGGKGDYANIGAYANGDDTGYEPIKPHRLIADGDRVELGGVSLTSHLTPKHTQGCTSWSMRANENGKGYDGLYVDSSFVRLPAYHLYIEPGNTHFAASESAIGELQISPHAATPVKLSTF